MSGVKLKQLSWVLLTCFALLACGGSDEAAEPPVSPAPMPEPPPPQPEPPSPPPPEPPPPTPEPEPEPDPEPEESPTIMHDFASAQRFLSFAGFGGSTEQIQELVGTDAADWVEEQLAIPYNAYLPRVIPKLRVTDNPERRWSFTSTQRYHLEFFWDAAITGDDMLRQRMLFALSQIFVANVANQRVAQRETYYLDMIGQNAFGNYRDLLQDITYTPLMGSYLTYLGNRRGDPETGRLPDENYAREILQLFSIGLVELEMTGELKLAGGEAIETYDNDDIVNLARVFTGLDFDPAEQGTAAHYKPMVMRENRHSQLEKNFLGTVIPANTPGTETIDLALDAIFEHPNVAPFISRQLIQRFTSSHPSPEYVERVANAFESGQFTAFGDKVFGSGQRGDFSATVAAILLEPSLFTPKEEISDEQLLTAGKIREPVLRFLHWARAFELENVNSSAEVWLRFYIDRASEGLGQRPFAAPSVFNFYRPGYVAAGTESGEMNLTTPEFQLVNSGTAIGYANFMTNYILDTTPTAGNVDAYTPNYTRQLALADDPAALAEHLSMLLTGGRMTESSKTAIENAVSSISILSASADADRLTRVRVAIIMAVNDPSFTVIY
ncbi:DUF1800 domain-containing protein [Glaciecola sp. MH2013]|uniref:DUF1800 domain-containing protein n=1 Tax=Glaciecola sp. MH2013 TaxID=2785524 RepID=UPI00189CB372|nr:DUF1800 family protein [Glaciecola sp. MH2013]MBF7073659.1 DUF1800 domain-containing protein [Glaciecola sp. MH2013]